MYTHTQAIINEIETAANTMKGLWEEAKMTTTKDDYIFKHKNADIAQLLCLIIIYYEIFKNIILL